MRVKHDVPTATTSNSPSTTIPAETGGSGTLSSCQQLANVLILVGFVALLTFLMLSAMTGGFVSEQQPGKGHGSLLLKETSKAGAAQERNPARESSAPPTVPTVPQMLCSGYRSPRTAICIHGAARTWPHLLVHRSQKENLIDALGLISTSDEDNDPEGPPGNANGNRNPTLFLHVTRADMRGNIRAGYGGLVPEWTEAHIHAAADRTQTVSV